VMYLVYEAYRCVSSPQARVGGPCHRARACHHAVSPPRGHDGLAGRACHRPAPVEEGRVTGPCHTPVVVAPRVIRVNVSPPAAAGAGGREPVKARRKQGRSRR